MSEAIEYVDRTYDNVPSASARKIKLKKLSFENISRKWKEFRLKRLKRSLENAKTKLTEMEFDGDKLKPGKSRERVERKVLRKTRAIANLESKINFLEKGSYLEESFVDSRAIKLKNVMMSNLVYNTNSRYSIPEDIAAQIKTDSSETSAIDNVIDETTKQIGATVREIMAEKKGNNGSSATTSSMTRPVQTPPTEPVISRTAISEAISEGLADKSDVQSVNPNDIKEAIDGEMTKIDVQPSINVADVKSAIGKEMDNITVEPNLSTDDVASTIDEAMDRVKISQNESSPAKVNKFINDDGTYRLRREDIDEDFRITNFDRSKIEEPSDLVITPFESAPEREMPNVGEPRKAVQQFAPIAAFKLPDVILPTAKSAEEMAINERIGSDRQPVEVVPEREAQSFTPSDKPEMSDSGATASLDGLLAKYKILSNELGESQRRKTEEDRRAAELAQKRIKAVEELRDRTSELEAACNANIQAADKVATANDAQEREIEQIMAALSAPVAVSSEIKGTGRRR